ncbi:MAG: integrin alpha [Candidatus Midichloria sp.]|nr:integrin alpha [Candidatus Midichloria sp.]
MTQSVFNLTSLNGKNGFAIDGINLGDSAGYSVASAGDINGDGKDDLIWCSLC